MRICQGAYRLTPLASSRTPREQHRSSESRRLRYPMRAPPRPQEGRIYRVRRLMSASEIPQNMKALSSVADQAQVLAIDALRLSLEIEKAMHSRLWRVLHRIEKLDDASPPRPAAVLDAIALSWQLIDTTHKIRTLADQVRGLSHSTPAYQLFLRNTARTEDFRNFFQHLGTEIPKLPLNTNPIMGVLSWVTRVSSKSRTIVYGTFPKDGNFYSLVLDT